MKPNKKIQPAVWGNAVTTCAGFLFCRTLPKEESSSHDSQQHNNLENHSNASIIQLRMSTGESTEQVSSTREGHQSQNGRRMFQDHTTPRMKTSTPSLQLLLGGGCVCCPCWLESLLLLLFVCSFGFSRWRGAHLPRELSQLSSSLLS